MFATLGVDGDYLVALVETTSASERVFFDFETHFVVGFCRCESNSLISSAMFNLALIAKRCVRSRRLLTIYPDKLLQNF